jgi:phage terminase large subunit
MWRANPVQFVRDNFGAEPDGWQARALMACVDNDRVGMCSAKGPGKSCDLAWTGWWFMACFPDCRGYATSITGDNLRDNLWAEFAFWLKKSPLLERTFIWHAERIANRKEPESWFISARTWPKGGDASQQANTLSGLHAPYTIVLIDESGGIPSSVTVAADASLGTGIKNIIVMAGNPEKTDGPLWDACNRDRKLWHIEFITGDPDDPNRSTRIKEKWAREQIAQWGPDNPWVLTNVFGKFPPTGSDKLLGPAEVDAAMHRTILPGSITHYPVIYGGDVAKSLTRNKSTFWKRQGPMTWLMGEWRLPNTIDLANQWARILLEEQNKGVDIKAVCIDNGGLSGVADYLIQLGWNCIIPIDNSWAASDPRFLNRRSEMYWNMAKGIKKNWCLPVNIQLKIDLTAPLIEYRTVGNRGMRFVLESKEDMEKRGLQSPDLGDGLALTCAVDMPIVGDHKEDKLRSRSGRAVTEYHPYENVTQEEEDPVYGST